MNCGIPTTAQMSDALAIDYIPYSLLQKKTFGMKD